MDYRIVYENDIPPFISCQISECKTDPKFGFSYVSCILDEKLNKFLYTFDIYITSDIDKNNKYVVISITKRFNELYDFYWYYLVNHENFKQLNIKSAPYKQLFNNNADLANIRVNIFNDIFPRLCNIPNMIVEKQFQDFINIDFIKLLFIFSKESQKYLLSTFQTNI